MGNITGWHAHLYYEAETIDKAKELCELIAQKFDVPIGTFHEKNVGPHPMWSVQISIDRNKFGRCIPWLVKNRDGLTVFVHALTGDDLKDHTQHALWMGQMLDLDLSIFK